MQTLKNRIAIIGPGAIGGTVAVWLSARETLLVQLCSRRKLDHLKLQYDGRESIARLPVHTEPEGLEPVDWVLVATKTYDAESAAKWLPGLMSDDTRLAVLQNGVEHVQRFSSYCNAENILPVVVDLPAERLSPVEIRQRGSGLMTVPDNPLGKAYQHLFAHTPIRVELTDDWLTAAWNKLCLNAAGVMSALTLQPAGVFDEPQICEIAKHIVGECAQVGRALGANLPDDIEDRVVGRYRSAPKDSINSLHGDRLAGRIGEIDARHGVIVRQGEKLGIPTPYNRMALALLSLEPSHHKSLN